MATFREIPGFSEYQASDDGQVRRAGSKDTLTQHLNRKGYACVSVSRDDGARRTIGVHRLMALAFLPIDEPIGKHARHIDGDKANNTIGNIAWGTATDNNHDMDRHGTLPRGSRVGTARLSESDVRSILDMQDRGISRYEIATAMGVHWCTVNRILNGRTWNHLTGIPKYRIPKRRALTASAGWPAATGEEG